MIEIDNGHIRLCHNTTRSICESWGDVSDAFATLADLRDATLDELTDMCLGCVLAGMPLAAHNDYVAGKCYAIVELHKRLPALPYSEVAAGDLPHCRICGVDIRNGRNDGKSAIHVGALCFKCSYTGLERCQCCGELKWLHTDDGVTLRCAKCFNAHGGEASDENSLAKRRLPLARGLTPFE